MANQQCETAVKRMFDYMNQRSLPTDIDQVIDPSWVNHDPSLPPMRGLDGFRQLHDFFWNSFSDLKLNIEHLFSDGEYVASHFTMQGRHTGDLMGVPATGKSFNISATGIFRCRNGKIVENTVNIDALGLFQQLGIVQMPGQAQRRAA